MVVFAQKIDLKPPDMEFAGVQFRNLPFDFEVWPLQAGRLPQRGRQLAYLVRQPPAGVIELDGQHRPHRRRPAEHEIDALAIDPVAPQRPLARLAGGDRKEIGERDLRADRKQCGVPFPMIVETGRLVARDRAQPVLVIVQAVRLARVKPILRGALEPDHVGRL
jgi:hypothetical protein